MNERILATRKAACGALILAGLCLGLGWWWGAGPSPVQAADAKEAPAAPKLAPLVVDKSAPLLLEEPKDAAGKGFLSINNACFVCHNNYAEEELVIQHAKEKTGCVDCHGQSFAHRDDEDNVTPPDKMYPLGKIDAACQQCHDTHDAPARKVLARWQERCPQKTDAATIVCTDCHGYHRLARRTVRWDKETGALISASKEKKKPAGP